MKTVSAFWAKMPPVAQVVVVVGAVLFFVTVFYRTFMGESLSG